MDELETIILALCHIYHKLGKDHRAVLIQNEQGHIIGSVKDIHVHASEKDVLITMGPK
jgi:hypothetical protein